MIGHKRLFILYLKYSQMKICIKKDFLTNSNRYLLQRIENLFYLVHVKNFLGKNEITHTLMLYLLFVHLFVISIVYWPPRTLEWLILRGENCWAIKTQEARFSFCILKFVSAYYTVIFFEAKCLYYMFCFRDYLFLRGQRMRTKPAT